MLYVALSTDTHATMKLEITRMADNVINWDEGTVIARESDKTIRWIRTQKSSTDTFAAAAAANWTDTRQVDIFHVSKFVKRAKAS